MANTSATERVRYMASRMAQGFDWLPPQKSWPETLDFYFLYPDGKDGDLNNYLVSRYAEEIKHISGLRYHAVLSTKDPESLSLFNPDPMRAKRDDDITWQIEANHNFIDFRNQNMLPYAAYRLFWSEAINEGARQKEEPFLTISRLSNYHAIRRKQLDALYSEIVAAGMNSKTRWVNEQKLFTLIRQKFPDAVYQYHTRWLGAQSLDIYIPDIKTAVEYQGKQHYEPIEIYDGADGFAKTVEWDAKKRKLCEENGVRLIEWKYDKPVTESAVDELFKNRT